MDRQFRHEGLSYRLAGSKIDLAYRFINLNRGKVSIKEYRRFVALDKTYKGSQNGCEFYSAATRWRAARGLPPIRSVSKGDGVAVLVCEGLKKKEEERLFMAAANKPKEQKEEEEWTTLKVVERLLEMPGEKTITIEGETVIASLRFGPVNK